MGSRSIFFSNAANAPKLRVSAKVWKFQIKFPCGFSLKENVANGKPVIWSIYQLLN